MITRPNIISKYGVRSTSSYSDQCRILHASLSWKSAIFDLHFLPGHQDIFALVTNEGEISVFNLARNPKDTEEPFQLVATHHIVEKEITFFAWYPSVGPSPPLLAATLEGEFFGRSG
jgi:hypothetical protein